MSKESKIPICGIVMPISAIDGCSESHWNDVLEILNHSIEIAGFDPNLVSNADDVGVIQKRIIQNLYDNPIVVCDVSGKNPNVMFELGIRLAFDKPTIIIKDDRTTYSFDTSPIEHLEYPRDLRFNKIQDFTAKLSEKIKKTYEKSVADSEFSTFLKHFGEFKVAKIDQKEVSQQEYILEELKSLRGLLQNNNRRVSYAKDFENGQDSIDICCRGAAISKIEELLPVILSIPDIVNVRIHERGPEHAHLKIKINPDTNASILRAEIQEILKAIHSPRKKLRKKNNLEND